MELLNCRRREEYRAVGIASVLPNLGDCGPGDHDQHGAGEFLGHAMITQETAARIWNCYREIKAAETLLADMEKSAQEYRRDVRAETLQDAFGRHQRLQLGVPSGENSHRLLDVSPELGKTVIRAHIEKKKAELAEANEQARIELDMK